jgi:hypothetical protein
MKHRKPAAILAALAATVGVSALAASAQAVVVNHDPIGTLSADPDLSLSTDSEVTFDYSNGEITPRLTGTLGTGGDRCYRVHLYSYNGSTLLHDKRGNSYCFNTAVHHDRSIDLSEDPDPATDTVVVALEKQNNKTKEWTEKSRATAGIALYMDPVRILGDGIDVGGFDFDAATGEPTGVTLVKWSIDDDGKATAAYNGTLHLDDWFPGCGRVELRYLDEAGKRVDTVDGGTNCPADKSHYKYTESLSAPASTQISQLRIAMQSSGDQGVTWQDVKTQTMSIGDY